MGDIDSRLMGVFVFAILIGDIRDIVSNARINVLTYQKHLDAVTAYMNNNKVARRVQVQRMPLNVITLEFDHNKWLIKLSMITLSGFYSINKYMVKYCSHYLRPPKKTKLTEL